MSIPQSSNSLNNGTPSDDFDPQAGFSAGKVDPLCSGDSVAVFIRDNLKRFKSDRAIMLEALKSLIAPLPEDERLIVGQELEALSILSGDEVDDYLHSCPQPTGAQSFQPMSFDDLITMPEKEWLIDQLIARGDTGEIFSAPGSGKTFVVIDTIFHACLGTPVADRFDVVHPLNVAYFAGEGLSGLPARFRAAAEHHGVTSLPNFSFYNKVPQLFAGSPDESIYRFIDEYKQAQATGKAKPLDLLFIDTLHSASEGANENDAADMRVVFKAAADCARELNCAVILVHHTNKGGDYRGSIAQLASCDVMIKLDRASDKLEMSCYKLKDGQAWKPQTFVIMAFGESAYIDWDAPSDRRNADQSIADRAFRLLRDHEGTKFTTKRVCEAIGGTVNAVNVGLARLADRGIVERDLQDPDKDASNRNPWLYWYDPAKAHDPFSTIIQ